MHYEQAHTASLLISSNPPAARLRRVARSMAMLAFIILCVAPFAFARTSSQKPSPAGRTRYDIKFDIDFDARRYTGTQRVRWVNRSERATSVLYFRLYPNARPTKAQRGAETDERLSGVEVKPSNGGAASVRAPAKSSDDKADDKVFDVEEARLEIITVRSPDGQPLPFSLDERETMLRVNLDGNIASAKSVEIEIAFRGTIPEIEAEETGLLAHVVQQVDAVLRDRREVRRAREVQFVSRGVMLLGMSYPILAARSAGEWERDKLSVHVGRAWHTEAADYEVTIAVAPNIKVFTSAAAREHAGATMKGETAVDGKVTHHFGGDNLRNFAIIAGRTLKFLEETIAGVTVRSIYLPEHETTARRTLVTAGEAVRIFTNRFGGLPSGTQVSVAEAPLVAGRGSAKFAGLGVIASAFYVDFDSAAVRSLPEIVREQRASVEDSLEWTIAQMVAHQWWGALVGSDPVREPVLDEALAQFSGLAYYRALYGDERARLALEDQLRGVYVVYRTFGGEDAPADREASDYRNAFQFAAIVSGKGALMLEALRVKLGDVRFFRALARFYERHRFQLARLDDLRASFAAETRPDATLDRRLIARHFNRWLSERHGDEDIAPPNAQLAAALGLNIAPATNATTPDERAQPAARNRFARLGIFFWKQMTKIR